MVAMEQTSTKPNATLSQPSWQSIAARFPRPKQMWAENWNWTLFEGRGSPQMD